MTINEQFSAIIQENKQEELIPFLKTLQPADKKVLSPLIKKKEKEYSRFGNISGNSFGYVNGSNEQRHMLQAAAFVCCSRADYEKTEMPESFIYEGKLKNVITWYVPDWFNDFVNKASDLEFFTVKYDWMIRLMEIDALRPKPELIVKSVEKMIFEQKNNTWYYVPGNLLKHPITLQEHVWYLFDYESNLHYSNRFLYFGNDVSKEDKSWHHALQTLVQEGRLDRQRVLKESLLASNKNFNKVLSGWFADLFANLKPTKTELLSLQKELVTVMHAPHSKPATMALQYLKLIVEEKETDVQAVLDALPVVLSNTTKALVNTAMQLLEQIAKKQPLYHALITQLCCQVFVHPEESLQLRAAKLIEKYADPADEIIRSQLATSREGILQTPRKTLAAFLEDKVVEKHEDAIIPVTVLKQTVQPAFEPIPAIETIDDLLFLAAQAFDNNESFHFDLLPAALVRMQHELKGAVLSHLQPALQRAIKIIRGGLRSTDGNYDQLLAVFFVDVCIHLVRKYPVDAGDLKKLFDSYAQRKDQQAFDFMALVEGQVWLPGWESDTKDPSYKPAQQLLMEALEKIEQGHSLPLLSTPTHQPGWLSADVLIDRWIQYKHQKDRPGYTDAQLAIARCHLVDTQNAIAKVKQEFEGEMQQILLFLLQPGAEPQPPFTMPQFWMMAALSKQPKKRYGVFEEFGYYTEFEKYTGQLPWKPVQEEYEISDWVKGKLVKMKKIRSELQIEFPWNKKKDPAKKSLLDKLKKKPGTAPPELIYDHFRVEHMFIANEKNDIRRALLMAPNNVEPLLAQVLQTSLRRPSWLSEDDKRFVIAALQLMYELWDEQDEMAYVFLAASLLCLDKTAANTAAEIWLKYAPAGKIDNALFGRVIGILESGEYAPLKRFTDLIMQSLFRVSPQHNCMLQVIIESMLVQLPDEPIKGLKKLLEILMELAALNKQPVETPSVEEKLAVWKEVDGLRKVVTGLQA